MFRINTAITFVVRVFMLFMQIIRSIIAARALGAGGKGILTIIYTTAQVIYLLVESGISLANVYFLGKKKYQVGEVFVNSIIIALLFGSAAAGGFLVWFHFNPRILGYFSPYYMYLAIPMVPLVLIAHYNAAIFQGLHKIVSYNILKIIEPLVFFIFFVVFVEIVRLEVAGAVYANIIGSVAACLFSVIMVLRVKDLKLKFSRRIFTQAVAFGFKGHIGSIGGYLNLHFDKYIINFYTDVEYVGLYSIATVVAGALLYLPNSLVPVLFPIVASKQRDDVHLFTAIVCRNTLFLTAIGGLGLLAVSGPLVRYVFGVEFVESTNALRILLPGIILLCVNKVISSYLIGVGKPTLPSLINWIMLLINIPMNVLLIPKWGINGAALSSTFAYGIGTVINIFIFTDIAGVSLSKALIVRREDFRYYHEFLSRKTTGQPHEKNIVR